MEIQLVIRAPNQNVDDQIIDCSDDWTVLQLKEHLSEVYPNKPVVKDQKLIYSGHLLQDNLQLKDVVRAADDESNVHIFHLVCNCKGPVLFAQAPKSSQSQDSVRQPTSTHSPDLVYSATNTLPQVAHPTLQESNFSMMPYNFPSLYNDPQMVTQMMAMQQMYAQYMIQYWQNVSAAMNDNVASTAVLPNQALPEGSNSVVAQAPPQQQAVQRVNAGEDEEAFDWFEFALQHFRFLALVGIMYFYSSPEKFFIVVSFLVFTALYREGWLFRETIEDLFNRLQNWVNQDANNVAGNNEDNQAQPINEEAQNGQELEAAMDGDNPPHVQNPDVINNNQQNSFLSIIAAFFFSLVPEAPPPVNIN